MIVNRAELANITGHALGTIDAMVKAGCPEEAPAGRERRFDSTKVIAWLVDRAKATTPASELQAVELREKAARAGLKEIDLAERSRTMIHVDDLRVLMDEQFSVVKSVLDQLPSRIAHAAAAESDAAVVRQIVRDAVHGAYGAMNADALAERLVSDASH